MTTTTQQVARRLRKMRINAGMNQAQFARKLGVSQQKLSDWENGKRLRAAIEAFPLVRWLGGRK